MSGTACSLEDACQQAQVRKEKVFKSRLRSRQGRNCKSSFRHRTFTKQPYVLQDMINQVSRCWKSAQGQNPLALTSDKSLPSQKKEQIHSRHSIQSKLTRLYFEELTKVPHATPDSVLVGSSFERPLANFYFSLKKKIHICERNI